MHSWTSSRAACSSPNTPPRPHDRLPAPKGSSPVSARCRGSPLRASSLGAPSVSLAGRPHLSMPPPIAYVVAAHLRSVRHRAPGSYPCASLASRCCAAPWKGSLPSRMTTSDASPERAPSSPATVARRLRCSPKLPSLPSRHADVRCATSLPARGLVSLPRAPRQPRFVCRLPREASVRCLRAVRCRDVRPALSPPWEGCARFVPVDPPSRPLPKQEPTSGSLSGVPLADLVRRQAVAERSVWTLQDEHLVHRASSSFFSRGSRLR